MCEPLIDANKAAEILGLHPKTVVEMAKRRELPALKVGYRWRFRESSLDAWVKKEMGVQSTCSPCQKGRSA